MEIRGYAVPFDLLLVLSFSRKLTGSLCPLLTAGISVGVGRKGDELWSGMKVALGDLSNALVINAFSAAFSTVQLRKRE